nr:DUF4394 domain-containing protein [Bacteroidota bacterium]
MKKLMNLLISVLIVLGLLLSANLNLLNSQNVYSKGFARSQKTVPAPAGPVEVIQYCIPFLDCSYGDGFESFALVDIENYNSGCSPDGYGDFTGMSTNLSAGDDYILYAETGYDGNYICVWIDFNDDGEFEADEMLIEDFYLEFGAQLYEIPLTIPMASQDGEHRLRARGIWDETATDPCGDFYDGETEDYTVNIIGAGFINDVGIVSIDIDGLLPPGPVTPMVTLKNYGTGTQTAQLSIINGVDYGTSAWVPDLLPGETRQITYADWNAEPGTYMFHAYLSDPDENPDNDQLFKEVIVQASITAFGFTPYDLSRADGSVISFDLSNPGSFDFLGSSIADENLVCACWYNNMIYAVQDGGGLYTIDPSDGTMTFVATTMPDITGLAYDGTTMFTSTTTFTFPIGLVSDLWEIDPLTGEETFIGTMDNDPCEMVGIACDGNGNLYGCDNTNNNFHSIDKSTGEATTIGNLGVNFLTGMDISFHKASNICYMAGYTTIGRLYMIDIDTGQATFLGEFQDGMEITALVIPDVEPVPPQNPQANVEGNSVFLSWEAPATWAIDGYNIYRDGQLNGYTTETGWADLCMLPGEYVYTIATVFEESESDPSTPVNATIMNCSVLLLEEGFEEYTIGEQLVLQAENMGIDYWHCWSTPAGSDEDPFVSNEQIFEGNNSLIIEGLNDAYMDLGGKTEGKFSVNFKLYVPSGFDGFFGIWREMSSWSSGMEAYFNEDETGFAIVANSDWQPFTYSADMWNDVRAVIDLDNDWAKLYLNNTMLCQAQWSLGPSGEPGPLKLDIIDFYAGVMWEGVPKSLVDNIEFSQIIDEPLLPENLVASVYENNVSLTWEAPLEGLIAYQILKDGNPAGNTSSLTFTDVGLETGDYNYEVKALYGDCESLPAGPVIATIHPSQTITIPDGWSGFSTCLNPDVPNVEQVFAGIVEELIILQSEYGMYWPGENVNTIGNINTHEGYKIKVTEQVELTIWGGLETDKTFYLEEGWNLLPVISLCDADIVSLFAGTDVMIIKEIAGYDIYWPEFGINTLGICKPGKGYFVLMGSPATIEFPDCLKLSGQISNNKPMQRNMPVIWNHVEPTPGSHLIYIPHKVALNGGLQSGDILGAFEPRGFCAGIY